MTTYEGFVSVIADRLYDGSPAGECVQCGMDDTPLVNDRCVWCTEASNVKYHRWQQAVRLGWSYKWMVEHEVLT